ncbi:MAG: response regulator [candidate division WOR-3 bacterium]
MTTNNTDYKGKILVIEDDDFMRENLVISFQDSGYEVIEAKDGEDALEKIANNGFVAIVSDLFIPSPNGLELYKTFHSMFPDIPFFIITAFPEQSVAKEAKALLGDHFIPKPIAVKKLLQYIKETGRKNEKE